MQKSKFLALLGILAVFMTLVACPPPADNSTPETQTIASIKPYVGSWKSTSPYSVPPYDEWFAISSDNIFTYYSNGDPSNDINYKGTVKSADVSGDYIFLNIKVTGKDGMYANLLLNSYMRVALEKLSGNTSVGMSTGGFYDYNTYYFDCTADTIDNLKTKFNLESGAYGSFGYYTKK